MDPTFTSPSDSLLSLNYITSILINVICNLSLLLNFIVIYIAFIKQNHSKAFDLQLVRLITLADLVYALWGVIHTSIRFSTDKLILFDPTWCAVSMFINSFSIMLSIGLVALLACLRYFKIVLGWNGEAKMFAWVTVGYVLFCGVLSALALVFTEWKPLGAAVWCQPWNLDNKFDLIYLIVTTVMYGLQVIALTIFYVFITLRFVQKLNQYQFTMESNNIDGQSGISASTTPTSIGSMDHMHNYNIKKRNNRQSTSILVKMSCLIFFYLCTILPYVIVTLSEIIQFRERDRVADAVLAVTINCINLVNPLFLVLLHEPTKRDFYYLMGVWYNWIFSSNKKLAFTVVQ